MIKIDPTKFRGDCSSYTATVSGNGGEDELAVCASAGQNGKVSIILIVIQIDGGVYMFGQPRRVPMSDLQSFFTHQLRQWCHQGMSPRGDDFEYIERTVRETVGQLMNWLNPDNC